MEQKLDMEHRMTAVEDRSKSNTHRLEELEKRQDDLDELVGTVKLLAYREEKVEKNVEEIKTDVKRLTNKPAQRWDSLMDKIMLTIAAALVGFVMAKLGF